jgi:hypothetical protein
MIRIVVDIDVVVHVVICHHNVVVVGAVGAVRVRVAIIIV